jgi:serine/threonine protein kinase
MEALERDNFSTIYLAREKRIKRMVALKVFSKEAIVQRDEGLESQLNNEIIIRSNLKHPNILPLFGYFYDNKRVYMFQEYAARSELYTEMKEVGFFSNEQAATVAIFLKF